MEIDIMQVNEIQVVGIDSCKFCSKTRQFLESIGAKYEWIDANKNPEERKKLSFYYEWNTVPGIFLNKKFVGGYTDLMELKESGEIVFPTQQLQPKL